MQFGFSTRRSARRGEDSLLALLLLSSLSWWSGSAIDPKERIGKCAPINLNVTYYVNENEGVWFPQYRSLTDIRRTRRNVYSCHTTYEKVYTDETEPARLESDTYYMLNGKVIKDSYSTSYTNTEQRGKLETDVAIADHGTYKIYNYFLALTPEYRVRYVCTDFQSTIPGVDAVYIETRKTFPKLRTINEAYKVLQKFHLAKKLIKINQKNCTRPIRMEGYMSMVSDEKSKK